MAVFPHRDWYGPFHIKVFLPFHMVLAHNNAHAPTDAASTCFASLLTNNNICHNSITNSTLISIHSATLSLRLFIGSNAIEYVDLLLPLSSRSLVRGGRKKIEITGSTAWDRRLDKDIYASTVKIGQAMQRAL